MKIETIETERLYLRGFEKEDADFAISIWNDPEMGEYLGDPTLDHVDEAYRKSIEALGENKTCCYLISESKAGKERIGTCSFIPRQDGKVYVAYCVQKKILAERVRHGDGKGYGGLRERPGGRKNHSLHRSGKRRLQCGGAETGIYRGQ